MQIGRLKRKAAAETDMAKRSKTWLADKLRQHMPSREEMESNRYLAPIAHRFLSPELWRFTRRSVPRGIALGLFTAFIIPIGQIFLAAFLALPTRANVPLAAAATFITNPFTLPFWLLIANEVGAFMLKVDAVTTGVAKHGIQTDGFAMLSELFEVAGVTAFGFVVLSIVTSAIGYLVAGAVWRVIVSRRRARRLRVMERRLDQRLGAGQG